MQVEISVNECASTLQCKSHSSYDKYCLTPLQEFTELIPQKTCSSAGQSGAFFGSVLNQQRKWTIIANVTSNPQPTQTDTI